MSENENESSTQNSETGERMEIPGGNSDSEHQSKPLRSGSQWFWRIAIGALVAWTLIFLLILALVIFPPLNLVKSYALPLVKENTGLDLSIDGIEYSLLHGIALHGVTLNAPQGYDSPLLTVKRIALHYDLREILHSRLIITEIAVMEPHIVVEMKDGRSSLDALLQGMPPSPPKTEETAPSPKSSGDSMRWTLVLEKLNVEKLTITAEHGAHFLDFRQLDLTAKGFLSNEDSHFDLTLRMAGEDADKPNLRLGQKSPSELAASLVLALNATLSVDKLYDFNAANFKEAFKPKAALTLDLLVQSREIKSEWKLDPVDLHLKLAAQADFSNDSAKLQSLTLDVNHSPWLGLEADLGGLFSPNAFSVLFHHLALPLADLAPYARSFVPGIDFGGNLRAENLKLSGTIPSLMQLGLPLLEGRIKLEDFRVAWPENSVTVEDLDLDLALSAKPDAAVPNLDEPAVQVLGELKLKRAVLPALSVEQATLSLDARGSDVDLGALPMPTGLLSLAASLKLPKIVLKDPALGGKSLSLALKLNVSAKPREEAWRLETLDLDLSRLIKLKLDALAHLDLTKKALKDYRVTATLLPVSLGELYAFLPKNVAETLPKLKPSGMLDAHVSSQGSLPDFLFQDPLSLPLVFDTNLSLRDLAVASSELDLDLRGGAFSLSAHGTPSRVELKGLFTLVQAAMPKQELLVEGVNMPIQALFEPMAASAKLSPAMDRITKKDMGLALDQFSVEAAVEAKGKLLNQELHHVGLQVKVDTQAFRLAKPLYAELKGQHLTLDAVYEAPQRRADIRVGLALDALNVPEQKLALEKLDFSLESRVDGLDFSPNGESKARPERVSLSIDNRIARLTKRDALDAPLENTGLSLVVMLENLRDLRIDKVELTLPSFGLGFGVKGRLLGLLDDDKNVADFKTRWPEFDLNLDLGVALDENRELLKGLEAKGEAGLSARFRSLSDRRMLVEGTLSAKHFDLVQRNSGVKKTEDGKEERFAKVLSMQDFNAQVPIHSKIDLATMRPVAAEENIFEETSRGVLYEAMRPYLKEQSNVRLKRLNYHAEEGEAVKDLSLDDLSLDMLIKDNIFAINRLYLALLGGGVSGSLQVQLLSLPPAPLDLRLHLENQITGINLAALTAKNPASLTTPSEISTLIEMNIGLQELLLQGRIDFTQISLLQLDDILKFLDPQGKDPSIQSNRELLNAWYLKMLKPKISLVSMRMQYSNLNMDIAMDAFAVGGILQRILENMKIRRFNVKPILRRHLGSILQGSAPAPANENLTTGEAAAGTP